VWLFTGREIPEPPFQHHPWQPPAGTEGDPLVSVTETLFRQGMADPRDC